MWCELRNTCTEPEATMTRVTSWGMVEDVRLGNWNQSLPVVAKRSPSVFWRRREEALILSFPKGTEWQWCQSCASQKTTHLAVPFTTRAECMTQKCVINVNKSADIDRGKFDTAAAMTTLLNKIHEGIKKKKLLFLFWHNLTKGWPWLPESVIKVISIKMLLQLNDWGQISDDAGSDHLTFIIKHRKPEEFAAFPQCSSTTVTMEHALISLHVIDNQDRFLYVKTRAISL